MNQYAHLSLEKITLAESLAGPYTQGLVTVELPSF
jgi:hypothetical protein